VKGNDTESDVSKLREVRFAPDGRPIYVLHGERINTLEDFFREIGEAVNGPSGYFGANLDALWDCLSGGFGTPEKGGYIIWWENSKASRQALGYTETVRQLEMRYLSEHESWHDDTRQRIDEARKHIGPTVFDWLVDLLIEASGFGVELELC
jgi:RNAse (barnase) inhibitor barstar